MPACQKIGFHTSQFSERGTEIALFDYARYNQQLLGHESVIFVPRHAPQQARVQARFEAEFQVVFYEDRADRERLATAHQLDAMYFIKSGERDDQLLQDTRSLIHAVFPVKLREVHGDVYAFVSEWLSKEYAHYKVPFVPHMIDLPQVSGDLREELSIPKAATVFGCYGGASSFDLALAREAVIELSSTRRDLYFVFMNIPAFCHNDRVRFLPGSTDLTRKIQFINTTDAMLHARSIGESFGLACGEFSVCNKPVFTYAKSPQRSHIDILGDKAFLYAGKRDLKAQLCAFDARHAAGQNWDAYSTRFSPGVVMQKFASVFLAGATAPPRLTVFDQLVISGYRLARQLRHHSKKLAR